MRKILLTGGAGYIGSGLVDGLLNNRFKVRVLDRFMFGGESLLPYLKNRNLEIVFGDIRDKKILKKSLTGVTNVIHLAALVGEPACKENPKVAREINFQATKNLVDLARKAGVNRFIFSSTCSNYGISSSKEATEETKLNPLSLYSKTKIESEEYILRARDKNFHPAILRLATVFGVSPKMRFNLMLNVFAREVAIGKEILIINKDAWRSFLHISDAVFAFLAVLNSPLKKVDGEIFNVVSTNIQKSKLIDLAKKYNPRIKIIVKTSLNKEDKNDYRVCAQKINSVVGWKPKITIEEGFIEMVNAVKNGFFFDTYDEKYNAWFDQKIFKEKYKL